MKILITGSAGQVGTDAARLLRSQHAVIALSAKEMDIADRSAVENLVSRIAPDIILNCAAYTKVDACETEKDRAWKVNVIGPENLARCVRDHGGFLIHISTDYVFDGNRTPPQPYVESDATAPLSCYGVTKCEGEKIIQKTTDRYLLLRTAWVYGIQGHNFLKTILRLALQNETKAIRVVNDQYGSPTWSYRLSEQIASLIAVKAHGIYHATAEGFCTWYEAARFFLEKIGIAHDVVPCTTADYPTPAARPRNSILENQRLKNQGLNLMRPWQEDVSEFVETFRNKLIAEARRTPS